MEGAGLGSNVNLLMTVTSRSQSSPLTVIHLRVKRHQKLEAVHLAEGPRGKQRRKSQKGSMWRRRGSDWVTAWFLLKELWSNIRCKGTESEPICPDSLLVTLRLPDTLIQYYLYPTYRVGACLIKFKHSDAKSWGLNHQPHCWWL